MKIAEEFRRRVSESKVLSAFVHGIEEREWGCVYLFAGKLESAIVQGVFIDAPNIIIDAQDISIAELDEKIRKDEATEYLHPWKRFDSVSHLVARMELDLA